jgi:hypothetical protein
MTRKEGCALVSDIGHVMIALGIGMLCWALAHWIDERFHRGDR